MRVLVIANDVVPGFGVPVAAPGLRAAGLAAGLSAHGHDVSVAVPSGVLDPLFAVGRPAAIDGVSVVDPTQLMTLIESSKPDLVVFSNANMTPHLEPRVGTRFVFDMFAPKLLESLSSDDPGRSWQEMAFEKERGLALADEVWVNGKRKLGYALGWLIRPAVDAMRQTTFGRASMVDDTLLENVHVVEMAVPLPDGVGIAIVEPNDSSPLRLGIAGYSQRWSALGRVHPAHSALVDAGHELHALLPAHWGGPAEHAPANQLPSATVVHEGPLRFGEFCSFVQSMHAMVDVFEPSPERTFAMITRSAVALRLGVPLLHGVDSEVAPIIRDYDAGWVIEPEDVSAWRRAADELGDPDVRARKRAGAERASIERFAPKAALADVARNLEQRCR